MIGKRSAVWGFRAEGPVKERERGVGISSMCLIPCNHIYRLVE